MKIVIRVQLREFQNTPPPPPAKLKIVRESIVREVQEFQNTPPKIKNVRESKSESFRIPPPQRKLSESPSPRVSEYPRQTENYQRVQVQEFQNTPSQNKKCQGVQI